MDTDKHRCAVRSSLSVFIRVHLWLMIWLREMRRWVLACPFVVACWVPRQVLGGSRLAAVLSMLAVGGQLPAAEPVADEPSIRVVTDNANRPVAFEAVGLPAAELAKLAARADADDAFNQLFSVHVAND